MEKNNLIRLLVSVAIIILSCQREASKSEQLKEEIATTRAIANKPAFNLEVIPGGQNSSFGKAIATNTR